MYAVLFDIDGTLILTGGAGQVAFARAFRDLFEVPELTGAVSFAGRSDRAIALDLMAAHGVDPSADNWQSFRESYLGHLPAALVEKAAEGCVLPGVAEFIAQLRQRDDVAVGLLTGNLQLGAQAKLTHYQLWEHFPFGGFGDEVTDRNDIAAAALAAAMDHTQAHNGLSGPLRETMVIGDTVHDIRCARSIGAYAVAVPTGHTPPETLAAERPDVLLDDLSDCTALLERIGAR
ncbi:MAG: haloacid dehalogenase [Planctomycetaceae bacterium]|nr:haloacid dehalogenase [Planctomycetaceae bacterium]